MNAVDIRGRLDGAKTMADEAIGLIGQLDGYIVGLIEVGRIVANELPDSGAKDDFLALFASAKIKIDEARDAIQAGASQGIAIRRTV